MIWEFSTVVTEKETILLAFPGADCCEPSDKLREDRYSPEEMLENNNNNSCLQQKEKNNLRSLGPGSLTPGAWQTLAYTS